MSNSSINEQSSWAALIKSAALIEQKELKSVVLSFLAVNVVKAKLGYDDALDVFGVHGVAGIWGAIAAGL